MTTCNCIVSRTVYASDAQRSFATHEPNCALAVVQQGGVIYTRRPRGKKLTFLMAGPPFVEAAKFVNWQGVAKMGSVVVWVGDDHIMRTVEVPTFAEQARMKFDAYVSRKNGTMDAIRITAQDLGRPAIEVAEAVGLTNEFINHSQYMG